jgi:hypothetical protein
MSADPFHLNRPVHLARRDVFYLKAVERIRQIPSQKQPAEQCKTAEQALYLLREARRHAEAANRSDKTSSQNRLFVRFMDIVVDNVQSIARMLRRQTFAEKPDNALDGFVGSSGAGVKMSSHYRRCAALMLKGLLSVLQQAEKPFSDLSRTSLAKMSMEDKARYEKAQKHFEELADGEAEKSAEFPD